MEGRLADLVLDAALEVLFAEGAVILIEYDWKRVGGNDEWYECDAFGDGCEGAEDAWRRHFWVEVGWFVVFFGGDLCGWFDW